MLEPIVTELEPTTRYIRANFALIDDGVEVINQDFQTKYSSKTGPTGWTKKDLASQMQAAINDYKTIQAIKAKPAFSNVFTDIQNSLEV
jgi:hypothetical protein